MLPVPEVGISPNTSGALSMREWDSTTTSFLLVVEEEGSLPRYQPVVWRWMASTLPSWSRSDCAWSWRATDERSGCFLEAETVVRRFGLQDSGRIGSVVAGDAVVGGGARI